MSLWIQFGLYEHKNFLYLFVCDFIIIIIYLFILYDLFAQQKRLGPPFNFNINEKGQNPPNNNSNALYNGHSPKWRDQLWAFRLVTQIQFYTLRWNLIFSSKVLNTILDIIYGLIESNQVYI